MRRLSVLLLCGLAAAACGDDDSGARADFDPVDPVDPGAPVSERVDYGAGPFQFGDLTVPAGDGPFPVVAFIHGGFWRNAYGLDLAESQADDAVRSGYATWNIEYRRVGDPGGGFPGTLADVARAIDHLAVLAAEAPLDLDRVAVVGHSAGGHLALWVGQREALPPGATGAAPAVVPRLVIGQAPVADLASNLDLGGGAVEAFMGATPTQNSAAYDVADPARLLPIRVSQMIVQGGADTTVPPERAERYAATVDEPEKLDLQIFPGAGHFAVIDPGDPSWLAVIDRLRVEFEMPTD